MKSGSYTESYGYSIVEALWYDIPILTFEKPILNEIGFFDGKNGYLLKKDRSNWNDVIKNINIASLNQNLHDNIGVVFPLSEYGLNSKYGTYNINAVSPPDPNYYSTNSTVTGELIITYYNFNPAIISGTFWFDAINSSGQKVEVRNGRFDVHL